MSVSLKFIYTLNALLIRIQVSLEKDEQLFQNFILKLWKKFPATFGK